MEIADNDVLDALWPKDIEDRPAPRPLARAFATLCGGLPPDAMYCQRDGNDESSTWRVLALVGSSIVEVLGVGDDLWTGQQSAAWARTSQTAEPVEMARCVPFEATVRAVHVIGTQEVERETGRWLTRWRLELDSGDLELPTLTGARQASERDSAENFALKVLARLHARASS